MKNQFNLPDIGFLLKILEKDKNLVKVYFLMHFVVSALYLFRLFTKDVNFLLKYEK